LERTEDKREAATQEEVKQMKQLQEEIISSK